MANYLYNGVELPELPEWDKTAYPYVVIRFATSPGVFDDCYIIEAYPGKPITVENTILGATVEYIKLETASSCLTVGSIDVDGDAWEVSQIVFEGEGKYGLKSIVWSNFDINHVDGTLYLAASEPVPVPVYDHTAMVQGWIVGKRLAAMRKGKKPDEPAEPVPFVSRDGDTIILMGAYKATLTDGILEVV